MIYVGGLRGWGGVGSGAYGTTGELARKINGGGGGGGSGGGDEGRDGMGYKMGEMKFTFTSKDSKNTQKHTLILKWKRPLVEYERLGGVQLLHI